MTHEAPQAPAKKDRDHTGATQLLDKARSLIDQAVREEQFEVAESLCQIASGAARQLGNPEILAALTRLPDGVCGPVPQGSQGSAGRISGVGHQ